MTIENKRRAPRQKLTKSLAVFDERSYRLDNWSRGGARIRDYDGSRHPGESFPIALELSTEKGRLRLVGEATVAWRDDDAMGLIWQLSESADEISPVLDLFLGNGGTAT